MEKPHSERPTAKILPFVRKEKPAPKEPENLLEQMEKQLMQNDDP